MTIYFIFAIIVLILGVLKKYSSLKISDKTYVIITFGIMILIAGLRSSSVGIDLKGHYANSFVELQSYSLNQVPIFAEIMDYEIGYTYYCKLLGMICSDVQFFIMVTSIFVYGTTAFFVYKKSDDVVFSTWLFLTTCMFYMYMNILRQAIAVSIVLFGYTLFSESKKKVKDYVLFIALILLAFSMHKSAIICLLFPIFDKMKFTKRSLGIGLCIIVVVYVFCEPISSVIFGLLEDSKYDRYTGGAEGGYINIQVIANFFLTAGAFIIGCHNIVFKKRHAHLQEGWNDKDENFLLYMGLFAMACRLLITRMNIINRMTYYFMPSILVLYPVAINAYSLKSNRKIISLFIYSLFGIYFVYMTLAYAGEFYGAVPFKFYWQ